MDWGKNSSLFSFVVITRSAVSVYIYIPVLLRFLGSENRSGAAAAAVFVRLGALRSVSSSLGVFTFLVYIWFHSR